MNSKVTDVLIVGAGPTGLTLAVSLLARGRQVTIVDKLKEGDNTSRAAVVYPGTLELLDPYGVAERLVARGIRTPKFTIRDRDHVLMPVPFDKLPTAFPYALLVSQAATEAELLKRLEQLGGNVLRPCEVTRITEEESGVTVAFSGGDTMRARFVVGADGVHSFVRQQVQIAYEGDSAGESYSLADVRLKGGVPDDELVVYFSPAGHLVVLPLPGSIHRVVAHVKDAPENPDIPFLQELLDTRGPKSERTVVHEVFWGSRFLTHHALAQRFRTGPILLAGDAAHEHSPLGGQGMNLGIHDAIALARALSAVLGGATTDLLDSYGEAQNRIAKGVINVTDMLTKIATTSEHLRGIRNVIVDVLDPMVHSRLAWRLSQLGYEKEIRENIQLI
ncbi:MAG TPA: FAD-dependent oxidoreductase [Bryobacteraceae bacterium]|nr:FAD-dependent oxidoreductase [Bryobacteraceae bacterium]